MPQKKSARETFTTICRHLMKSKFLAIIISIILLAGMMPTSVFAYVETYSGTCSDGIAWSLDAEGTLTIGLQDDCDSGEILEAPWLEYASSINKIVIEEGISAIHGHIIDEAFQSGAFAGCTSLTEVELPDSLTLIGSEAFNSCTSLSVINIPDDVSTIADRAFYGCVSLEDIILPRMVDFGFVGEDAFTGSGLISVTLADNWEGIPAHLFKGIETLTSVAMPDTEVLNYIGDNAFYGCTSLEEITLPPLSSSISIGTDVFVNSGLKSVEFAEGTEAIPANLFKDVSTLTSVTIPDTVEGIGDYAFYGCSSLEEITLPPLIGTGYIGTDAFVNSGLKSAVLEYGMEAIPANLFKNVDTLTSVTIPETVENIGDNAFYGCTSLEEITLPPLVGTGTIGTDVFVNSGLKSAVLEYGMEAIPANLFNGVETLTSVTIPETVENIGDSAFYGCTSLEEITLPPLVGTGTIGANVFANSGLKRAVLEEGMEEIPESLFNGLTSLTSVTIPSSITSIRNYSFFNCTALNDVTLPAGLTEIGYNAFYGCTSLSQITIPSGVTNASYAFQDSGLTAATLEDGITEVPSDIFNGSGELEAVNIPSSVTSIGQYAFSGTALTDVYYPGYGSDWNNITISYGNEALDDATKHFNAGLIPEIEDSQLVLDQAVDFSANGNCSQYYAFTPSESGYYRISSEGGYCEENSCNSWMGITVYDDQFKYNGNYSVYENSYGFRFESWFENGKTYIINVEQYDSSFVGDCPVIVTQILSTENAKYYGDDAGSYLYWALSDGTLTIEGTDAMGDFTSASQAPWYKYKAQINRLVVGENVKTIGQRAFTSYTNLASAELPDSLTDIGMNAFSSTGLTNVQYGGSKGDWTGISIGNNNKPLTNATFTYAKNDIYISNEIQNGSIYVNGSVSRCSAKQGETIIIEAIPDVYNHYIDVGSLICSTTGGATVSTVSLPGDADHPDSKYYSFEMPDEDVTVTAIFSLETFPVTISSDVGCTLIVTTDDPEYPNERIVVSDGDYLEYGATLYITATPKMGYSMVNDPSYGYTDWTETVVSDMEIAATSELNNYWVNVSAEGDGYTRPSVDSNIFSDYSSNSYGFNGRAAYGTSISITAGDPESNCEFIGWYQPNGKLLSNEKEYTFILGAEDITLIPRYQVKDGIVTFMANDMPVGTFMFDGETLITENDFPSEPSGMYGFEFDRWDKTVNEINEALNNGVNVTVTALFKPAAVSFTVTIYNGEKAIPIIKTYTENKWISLKADEVSGKNFAYWMMNDQILNYNATASFRASENCTVTAVYTTDAVDPQGTAIIKSAKYNNSSLVFVSYLTVPDGASINRAGLLAASPAVDNSKYTVGDELTFENADYVKKSAKAVGTSGPVTYTWTKTSVSVNDVWYARPYVVYTLGGEENTVYGSMITVNAGDDYDSNEKATAIIRSSSYDGSSAKFVAYLTVPDGSTIEKAGVVATSSNNWFDPTNTVLKWENALFRKVSQKAIGTSGPVSYTWTKTNAREGGTWYVKPYVIYRDSSDVQHTVYGLMTTLQTDN